MKKQLFLSETDKKLLGVCGGIGEYFDIDPTLVRLIWVIFTTFTAVFGGGIIVYILAAFIIPKKGQV